MKNYYQYPKISEVKPKENYQLLVTFDNGIIKNYDFKKLLLQPVFSPLLNIFLFRSVKVDSGGYGIYWNDELDLAESELWINGDEVKNI